MVTAVISFTGNRRASQTPSLSQAVPAWNPARRKCRRLHCLRPVCSRRFFSPISLHHQNFFAAFFPVCSFRTAQMVPDQNIWSAPSHEYPDEMRSSHNHANRSQMTSFCAALRLSVVHIQFCVNAFCSKTIRLCKHMPVFRNDIVSGKNQVLRRLPFSGTCSK